MKGPSLAATLLVASFLPLLSSAWPLLNLRNIQPSPRNPLPATYSVVAVGGGSTTTAAATETITQPVSITTTLLSTIVSTIVVTEAETPTTILITLTLSEPPTTTVVVTPEITTTVEPQPPAVTTQVLATLTVTASTTVTSEAYDDGMWHTTYYHAVPAAPTVASVPSTDLVESFPTQTSEDAPAATLTPSTISFPNFMNGTIPELPRLRRS